MNGLHLTRRGVLGSVIGGLASGTFGPLVAAATPDRAEGELDGVGDAYWPFSPIEQIIAFIPPGGAQGRVSVLQSTPAGTVIIAQEDEIQDTQSWYVSPAPNRPGTFNIIVSIGAASSRTHLAWSADQSSASLAEPAPESPRQQWVFEGRQVGGRILYRVRAAAEGLGNCLTLNGQSISLQPPASDPMAQRWGFAPRADILPQNTNDWDYRPLVDLSDYLQSFPNRTVFRLFAGEVVVSKGFLRTPWPPEIIDVRIDCHTLTLQVAPTSGGTGAPFVRLGGPGVDSGFGLLSHPLDLASFAPSSIGRAAKGERGYDGARFEVNALNVRQAVPGARLFIDTRGGIGARGQQGYMGRSGIELEDVEDGGDGGDGGIGGDGGEIIFRMDKIDPPGSPNSVLSALADAGAGGPGGAGGRGGHNFSTDKTKNIGKPGAAGAAGRSGTIDATMGNALSGMQADDLPISLQLRIHQAFTEELLALVETGDRNAFAERTGWLRALALQLNYKDVVDRFSQTEKYLGENAQHPGWNAPFLAQRPQASAGKVRAQLRLLQDAIDREDSVEGRSPFIGTAAKALAALSSAGSAPPGACFGVEPSTINLELADLSGRLPPDDSLVDLDRWLGRRNYLTAEDSQGIRAASVGIDDALIAVIAASPAFAGLFGSQGGTEPLRQCTRAEQIAWAQYYRDFNARYEIVDRDWNQYKLERPKLDEANNEQVDREKDASQRRARDQRLRRPKNPARPPLFTGTPRLVAILAQLEPVEDELDSSSPTRFVATFEGFIDLGLTDPATRALFSLLGADFFTFVVTAEVAPDRLDPANVGYWHVVTVELGRGTGEATGIGTLPGPTLSKDENPFPLMPILLGPIPAEVGAVSRLDDFSAFALNAAFGFVGADVKDPPSEEAFNTATLPAVVENVDTTRVVVVDVGQGSANALFSNAGGILAIDAGERTVDQYLYGLTAGDQRRTIIISHWDFDHCRGLAPLMLGGRDFSVIGPTYGTCSPMVRSLVRAIGSRGRRRLFLIGSTRVGFVAGLTLQRVGAVIRPTPWEIVRQRGVRVPIGVTLSLSNAAIAERRLDRNNSGSLVAAVRYVTAQGNRKALLPGDCSYKYIPATLKDGLTHLVATHHGSIRSLRKVIGNGAGTLQDNDIPSFVPQAGVAAGTVIYSYRAGNSYGFSARKAGRFYWPKGWTRVLTTADNDDVTLGG